jgi:hypothetical protein
VCIYRALKCIIHILVLLNLLFKVLKWIEEKKETIYIDDQRRHTIVDVEEENVF